MWVLRALLLGNHRGWVPGEGLGISGKAWGWGGLVTGEGQGDPVGCVCIYKTGGRWSWFVLYLGQDKCLNLQGGVELTAHKARLGQILLVKYICMASTIKYI